MMRNGVFNITIIILILTTGLVSIPVSEGRVEYVERDYLTRTLPQSVGEGFEPHILAGTSIDGDQWYYVDTPTGLGSTEGQGGNLWISKDYGESWEWYDKDMAIGTGRSGDSYTAISEDGNIYYTDLYLTTASVDFSLDGGETWIQNPFASEYVVVDRQWLQIGPDGSGGEILYFSFNQLLSGLVMVKSSLIGGAPLDWVPCNGGWPIATDVGSRDNMVVDQNNGNIYHANYQSNGIYCYISTDQGNSFVGVEVHDETVHANVQNTFMDIDVDSAGNVYMIWSSREHIMLAVSTDEGMSWTVHQVTERDGCRVLPWIAGGDEGRIAMAWFDTNDTGNPNNLDDSVWDYIVATSIDATAEEPLFQFANIDPGAHVGSVRTSGLDGDEGPAPDRDLGDYIGIDIDEMGRVITAWGPDGDDGPNARNNPCVFARQNEGPFLLENVGPEANFTVKKDGLEVKVDGSLSEDLGGGAIANYVWDFGDGTNVSNVSKANHEYSDEGTYTIILTVINEEGQMMRKAMTLTVEEDEGFPAAVAGGIGAFLIFLIIVLVIFLKISQSGEKEIGEEMPINKGGEGSVEWEMPEGVEKEPGRKSSMGSPP